MKLISLPLASLLVLLPVAAAAQSADPMVSIPNESTQPVLLEADGTTVVTRDVMLNLRNNLFSYEDCVKDRKIRYQLAVANTDPTLPLEVWVSQGQECAGASSAGRGSPANTCWRGQREPIPNAAVANVVLRLQDLAALNTGLDRASEYVEGTADQCRGLNNLPFNIEFLFVRGVNSVGEGAMASVILDTVGPNPPTGVVAITQGADTYVSWDLPTAPTAVSAYNVYCDAAADAAACSSATLRAGELPAAGAIPCATVSASELEARVLGRSEVGAPFAVSAIDTVGNPGPLSELACSEKGVSLATAGTQLGGGGCSAAAGSLGASSGLLAALSLLAVGRRRQRAAQTR